MEGRFFDKKVVYRNFCTIYLILWMLQAYCSCGWCDHGQKPIYNNWNWCYMYLWSAAGTGTFDEHQHRQVAYVTVIVQLSWRYGKLKLTGFYRVTMGITVSPWALPCHHGRYRVTMGVGRGAEEGLFPLLDIEIWHFGITVSAERGCFLSFERDK